MASSSDSSESDAGCCSKGTKALTLGVLGLGVCGAFFFWLFLCARDAGAQTNSIAAERERRLQADRAAAVGPRQGLPERLCHCLTIVAWRRSSMVGQQTCQL